MKLSTLEMMKPRLHFLTASLVMALAALAFFATPLAAAPAEKPNILLIIADDLNNWIGPMGGNPQTQTPNLDKLAARGVTFRNAQCAAPLCNPSRTAFLSGMRPSTTGIYDNQQVWMPHIGRGLCLNDYVRKFGYTSLGRRQDLSLPQLPRRGLGPGGVLRGRHAADASGHPLAGAVRLPDVH